MSNLDQLSQLIGLMQGTNELDLSGVVEGFGQRLAASAAKDIAEARQILGDDAHLYLPISSQAIRAQREQLKLEHERQLMALELREREAKVRMTEAGAAVIHGNNTAPAQSQP